MQSITENTSQNVASSMLQLTNAKNGKDKLKTKLKQKEYKQFEKKENTQDGHCDKSNTVVSEINKIDPKQSVAFTNATCKLESVESVHSELDIKDEGPIYVSGPNQYEQNSYGPANPQQNYYYVMQNPGIAAGGSVVSPLGTPMMQQNVIVQGIAPPQVQSYYVAQPSTQPSYVMQNSQTNFLPVQQQPVFQQQGPQMMTTQPYVNSVSYVPYMLTTSTQPQQYVVASNPMTNQQNPPKLQNRNCNQNIRYITTSRQISQNPTAKGNNTPVKDICSKPTNVSQQCTSKSPRRKVLQTTGTESSGQKTTSLIVLSDSDDEIEMIITEKTNTEKESGKTNSAQTQKIVNQPKQKPVITSDITVASAKDVIPPQIIQRMSQGGISITPIKNTPPPPMTNTNTQLVVVVNETGNHYALALPNGSKLILTPEQVAQIRASNGGKLIL